MHFMFIPYGNRAEVEVLLRDMECQKHKLKLTKGKQEKIIYAQGGIRQLPLGIYEYIFPEEDLDMVLATLIEVPVGSETWKKNRYDISSFKLGFVRKLIKAKKIPEFSRKECYIWIKQDVRIIPLGIREDKQTTDDFGEYKGWTHEAI